MAINVSAKQLASGGSEVSYEPQRSNNFLIQVDTSNLNLGISDEVLELAVETSQLPGLGVEEQELAHGNEKVYVAGRPSVEELPISYKDFVDKDVATALWRWFQKTYDPKSGKIGLARDYKTTAYIILAAPNGEYERKWTLEGLWIKTMSPVSLDNTGGEPVKVECSFRYDRAYPATLSAI